MTDGQGRHSGHGGDGREPITAAAIAARTGGRVIGDEHHVVHSVAPLDRATRSDLSFFSHARYTAWFAVTQAGVVLVTPDLADQPTTAAVRIVVDKPTDAMIGLLAHFQQPTARPAGVHASAAIGERVRIGRNVAIEAFAVIGDDVTIGDDSWIGAHVSVGEGSRIGASSRLHASCTVYPRVEIGDRVVVHAGARIGREGFGFVPRDGAVVRIPHIGRCVLEHDVEIGANSCVDRGSVDDTIIGAGTKIDNLVHVAHNVRIGRMCFLAAQVGIAGSARIGDGVQVGGQAGLGGHITIGSHANLGGQAGVFGDVPAGETWSGYPARPHRESLRVSAAVHRLAKIVRPLERLVGDRQAGVGE